MIEHYLAKLKAELTYSEVVRDVEILDEFVTEVSGFIECKITIIDGSILYFTEYVKLEKVRIKRDKYSFHWLKSGQMIFRYDNAPHHKEIKTYPHHKHIGPEGNEVVESLAVSLTDVLNEIAEKKHEL
ncbi:MAG: hypothetical protein KAU14_10050 [Thermoplasmata archaeon]|nr:hypothetical protein [Thermoplasmata archaeon]